MNENHKETNRILQEISTALAVIAFLLLSIIMMISVYILFGAI